MATVFSGGLIYEYSNETNNYGLVQISDNGTTVTKLPEFYNLKKKYDSVPDPAGDGGYSTSNKISECPAYSKGMWEANNTLHEMPAAASTYFTSGAGTPLGTIVSTQDMCGDVEDDDSDSISISTTTSISTISSSSSDDRSEVTSTATDTATSQSDTDSVSKQVSSSSMITSSKSKGSGNNMISTPVLFQWICYIWNIIL